MKAARIVRCIAAARFIVSLSKKTPHEKKNISTKSSNDQHEPKTKNLYHSLTAFIHFSCFFEGIKTQQLSRKVFCL